MVASEKQKPQGGCLGAVEGRREGRLLGTASLLAGQFADDCTDDEASKGLDGRGKDNGDHGFSWFGSVTQRTSAAAGLERSVTKRMTSE